MSLSIRKPKYKYMSFNCLDAWGKYNSIFFFKKNSYKIRGVGRQCIWFYWHRNVLYVWLTISGLSILENSNFSCPHIFLIFWQPKKTGSLKPDVGIHGEPIWAQSKRIWPNSWFVHFFKRSRRLIRVILDLHHIGVPMASSINKLVCALLALNTHQFRNSLCRN